MDTTWLIIISAAVLVVAGSIIALVWWHLADVIFPGAAEKTGQRIITWKRRNPRRSNAVVVSEADFAEASQGPKADGGGTDGRTESGPAP